MTQQFFRIYLPRYIFSKWLKTDLFLSAGQKSDLQVNLVFSRSDKTRVETIWRQRKLKWLPGMPDCFATTYQNGTKYTKITRKYTKWPLNMANGRKVYQMDIKYTTNFHCKTLKNLPKFGFLVSKYTIWQPCRTPIFMTRQSHEKVRNKSQRRACLSICWTGFHQP
jgi:hypothetical protein